MKALVATALSPTMPQIEAENQSLWSIITCDRNHGQAADDTYTSLLNSVRQGVLLLDAKAEIHYANNAARQLLNLDQGVLNAFPDCDLSVVLDNMRLDQMPVELELRAPLQERQEDRVYRVELSPLASNAELFRMLVDDVTQQRLTEQIRKDFVTNASHELRTPLSLISGYIETLQGGLIKGNGSMQRCLEVMEKHSQRMMRIIEDMLTISRLENGDAQLRYESFPVRSCVNDVLEHLAPLIEQRQPQIILSFPDSGGLLNGDRFYWDQVFTNLIENALKENQRTGLTLRISGHWTDGCCTLTVEDDGVGIPPEDVPFVFKRFFRCAKHHSQEIKGTGLGLSIVKRAVEAHGGTIRLQSEPGKRTAFIMSIPR